MTRQQLIDAIEKYRPYNEQEEMDKPLILNWIKNEKDAFLRENKIAHITASAWVVNKDRSKVLMCIITSIIPGPGWEAMQTGRQICCRLPSGK